MTKPQIENQIEGRVQSNFDDKLRYKLEKLIFQTFVFRLQSIPKLESFTPILHPVVFWFTQWEKMLIETVGDDTWM